MESLIIGLDSYPLISSKSRGIGNYALNLYENLFMIYPNIKFVLFDWGIGKLGLDTSYKNVSVYVSSIEDGFFNENSLEICIDTFLHEKEIDIFFTPNVVDLTFPKYKKKWFGDVKLIGTIHDIIPWILQDQYLRGNQKKIYKKYCENLCEYDWLYADSECTKKDVSTFFYKKNIYNIYLGPNIVLQEVDGTDRITWRQLKNRKKILDNYLIFVGGTGINKNLNSVVRAYKKVIDFNNERNIPQLVIVCSLTDAIKRDIFFYFKDSKYSQHIKFTDFVSDDELKMLYANASWAVFPTLYEGFGMPVIEAWMYGLPVMTSNNSSLGEISKDCAVQVNPFSVDSIAEGFQRIIDMDDEDKMQFINKGRERLKRFTWRKTCQDFINVVFDNLNGKFYEI